VRINRMPKFLPGTAYVIYGYRTPEGIDVGICSRTKPLADAAEDLAYLRAAPTLPDTGFIYVIAGPPFRPPLSGVRTTINGEGSQTAASTDAAGEATFASLQRGTYSISAEAEGYFPAQRQVEIPAKGCAEVRMPMMLDRRIQGRVLTSDGRAAAGVQIQVRPIERPVWDQAESVTTDAEGNYEFRRFIQGGGYFLGVNLDHPPTLENPYTRWFFPGTNNLGVATPLYFGDAPETKYHDLMLPPRRERTACDFATG
jgi:hypothetical protein